MATSSSKVILTTSTKRRGTRHHASFNNAQRGAEEQIMVNMKKRKIVAIFFGMMTIMLIMACSKEKQFEYKLVGNWQTESVTFDYGSSGPQSVEIEGWQNYTNVPREFKLKDDATFELKVKGNWYYGGWRYYGNENEGQFYFYFDDNPWEFYDDYLRLFLLDGNENQIRLFMDPAKVDQGADPYYGGAPQATIIMKKW